MKIHTPYDGSAKPFTIGIRPIEIAQWLEIDDNFGLYIAEKRRLYREEFENVLVAEAGTEDAQVEVLELIEHHLQQFPKLDRGMRRDDSNLGRVEMGRADILAQAALLIQDDMVLMRKSPEGWRLVAASLCFPSAWNLREKFGKPLHEVHGPVPNFNTGTRNAEMIERMFDNLRADQLVLRWNWSLYGDARLYHPASDHGMKRRFGDGDIAGRVTLRLERQTLRKLPKSGDILFAIRIYIDPLEVLETHPDGAALAGAIADQLAEMRDAEIKYKGLADERARLLERLAQIGEQHLAK
jgi:dimethylamine monooxygenase subunit A